MVVTIVYAGKEKKVAVAPCGGTVEDALKNAGISPATVLVRRRRTIVPDTAPVADGERLEVLNVVSGG